MSWCLFTPRKILTKTPNFSLAVRMKTSVPHLLPRVLTICRLSFTIIQLTKEQLALLNVSMKSSVIATVVVRT